MKFLIMRKNGVKGSSAGLLLCENNEKVCSFCADVIGDICSTLSGACGACVVAGLTENVSNSGIVLLISCLVSAFIAGITIFLKALMKERAIAKSNEIILRLGKFLEKTLLKKKRQKTKKI